VFTPGYQTLRNTGTSPGVRIRVEGDVNEGVDEEVIDQIVQSSPLARTQKIARRLRVPQKISGRLIFVEQRVLML